MSDFSHAGCVKEGLGVCACPRCAPRPYVGSRGAQLIARRFHEEYERLAPRYGWETQKASRVGWWDLPDNQRALMIHVVDNLLVEALDGFCSYLSAPAPNRGHNRTDNGTFGPAPDALGCDPPAHL